MKPPLAKVNREIAEMSHAALETSNVTVSETENHNKSAFIVLWSEDSAEVTGNFPRDNSQPHKASGSETIKPQTKQINMEPIEELFILKCKLCSVIFSMEVNDAYFEAREAKRGTLLELIELMDGEK